MKYANLQKLAAVVRVLRDSGAYEVLSDEQKALVRQWEKAVQRKIHVVAPPKREGEHA